MPVPVPVPVLVWLPNAFFIVLTVVIIFLTLNWIADPPRSFAEGIIEAHKVIIVGGVSLAAVAVVEVISIAPKLDPNYLAVVIIGATVLVCDAFFGLALFTAALVRYEKIRATNRIDRAAFWQVFCGVLVFGIAICVIVKFKYIDIDLTQALARGD